MKFAEPLWLFGTGLALLVAVLLIAGGFLLQRAVRRFGEEALVGRLVTGRPGGRRALKGGLLVSALALAFVALAQPQYGRGTRLIPATNLDVVIVLDYSKSMFARDIPPSRTLRAKSEVTRLIGDLPGARFGAVAFAGQPMAFPLTSDGGAIAQFFRQLSPNDMPVGGTAIARAMEAGRELFARDPVSKRHERVMLLVTDGEDLEGDPVAVAQGLASEDIAVFVVQVGGRTPEPIPEVDEAGQVTGFRRDEEGKPLTTSLSAAGEEQLAKIAQVSAGQIVRSETGSTGIDVVAGRFRQLMTEELSERVETVYADVFHYPLSLAVLLLLLETFVNETKPRPRPSALLPPDPRTRRRPRRKTRPGLAGGILLSLLFGAACSKGGSLFERRAPAVDDALDALDAGDAGAAVDLLSRYLSTGKCEKGEIGTPEPVRQRPNASFDLGLGLFQLAERFGQRFGEDPSVRDGGPSAEEQALADQRGAEVDCALRVVRLIAADASLAPDLRARSHYLAGNLEFLRGDYRSAVKSYDTTLRIIPGLPVDAGDSVGRDAAHNRAIALRRIEDEDNRRDAGHDAGSPDAGSPDAGPPDAGQDGGPPDAGGGPPDAGDDDPPADGGKDAGAPETPDAGADGGVPDASASEPKPQPKNESGANQDERLLDQLEQAPTLQEHDAKNRALTRRSYGMEDK